MIALSKNPWFFVLTRPRAYLLMSCNRFVILWSRIGSYLFYSYVFVLLIIESETDLTFLSPYGVGLMSADIALTWVYVNTYCFPAHQALAIITLLSSFTLRGIGWSLWWMSNILLSRLSILTASVFVYFWFSIKSLFTVRVFDIARPSAETLCIFVFEYESTNCILWVCRFLYLHINV